MFSLFGFKKKEPEVVNIKPGQLWKSKSKDGDPFPPKDRDAIKILDFKNGWVRYAYPTIFTDERMALSSFLYVFELLEDVKDDTVTVFNMTCDGKHIDDVERNILKAFNEEIAKLPKDIDGTFTATITWKKKS
jgi:hypothetical protein